MSTYKTEKNIEQIDVYLKSISNIRFAFFPFDKIIYAKRDGDKIVLRGLFYKATGKIAQVENEINLVLNVSIILSLKLISVFYVVFLSSFLFFKNVIINGNIESTFTDRLVFVTFGIIMFAILVLIVIIMKAAFTKKIEEELNLIKTCC